MNTNITKMAKVLTMGILALGAWVGDWLLLKQSIYSDLSLTFFGWPSLVTILGIIFLTFFLLINKNRIIAIVLDILIFVSYLMIMPKDPYVILGGGIFLAATIFYEHRLAAEGKSQLDFSMRRVLSGSISLVIYPLLLLIGLNVYYNTKTDFQSNPDAYYQKLEQTVSKAANRTVPLVTDKYAQGLSDEEKQQISDSIAQDTVNKIKESTGRYQQYFPFILAIIVTGLLSTFSFLIRWATIFIGWFIFRSLLLMHFFKIEKQLVEVQKLDV